MLISNFGILTTSGSIPVSELSPGSHAIVKVQCDYCENKPKYMEYKVFIKATEENGKYACNGCKGKKLKELMRIRAERGDYAEKDKGYYSYRPNRLKLVKNYIEKYGSLERLSSNKDGQRIMNVIRKYEEQLIDIVQELGYDWDELNKHKPRGYFKTIDLLSAELWKLIKRIGRFPVYREISQELNISWYTIQKFGGLYEIKRKMNYDDRKDLQDDRGFYNRSTYEYILAQYLIHNSVQYLREQNPFPEEFRDFRSDFTFYPEDGNPIHLEIWGREHSEEYDIKRAAKTALYEMFKEQITLLSIEPEVFRHHNKYSDIQEKLGEILSPILKLPLKTVENGLLFPPSKLLNDELFEAIMHYSQDGSTVPTYNELRAIGKYRLFDEAVKRFGNFTKFQIKYNKIPLQKNKGFWTDKKVFEQLSIIMKERGNISFKMREYLQHNEIYKGLFDRLNSDIKLRFYEHCLNQGIEIPEKEIEAIVKMSMGTNPYHGFCEEKQEKAAAILNQLNEIGG
ncbi:hypothetical protein [Bacillus sp. ISL-77]|uniref:hypothetical protein n=1 Tax=Bacillus sp. ISL-77 TaxID=2819138 RepID=UPI001BE8CA77|nr:hypothetical protein [Bacillus sp. ISL-77]MBT2740552.1 hypothetical protein [Bacillus sp. ISL-77]